MSDLGYLVAAYVFAGGAVAAYLVVLRRRRRSLERRLEQLGDGAPRRAPDSVTPL
jgi:CcmD family protein